MTMGEWIAGAGGIDLKVLGVIALAVLVRSTLGFGDALVAMPLLVLAGSETRPATALVAAVSLMTAAAIFAIDVGDADAAHEELPINVDKLDTSLAAFFPKMQSM